MGLTFLFPGRFWRWNRETNSPPAGPTRRFHEGAHDYRGDCARRATDRRRLRRLGHPRLRRALGLLGDLLDHDTGHLHTFGNRLNHRCAEQASEPLDHYDCKPFGRFDADADPNADPDANPNPNPNANATQSASAYPTAAPSTGGGGTAGVQDVLLFGLGGGAILAGAGSIAYRRKLTRGR